MKVIVPDTIDLALTNVAANTQPIWHFAERYDIGDYVQYQGSIPHKVYKSLRAYNQNKPPPDHTEVEEISTPSSTSTTIATGAKKFTVRGDLNIVVGTIVTIGHAALPGSFSMTGEVTGYNPPGASPSAGTPSRTASASPSHTVSTSPSSSPSHTASASPSGSPSHTVSSSPSGSASHSPSAGSSPSDSPSHTVSTSPSGSVSSSPSSTVSGSPSDSPSSTVSGSPSATPSEGTEYDLEVNVLTITGTGTFDTWMITNDDTVPFWEEISSTNQYKMFDESVNSQTERTTSIDVSLNTSAVDGVALFGLVANEVVVEFWDADESVLYYSETVDLVYGSNVVASISDWWEYFFGEMGSVTEVVVESDVAVSTGLVKIEINHTSGLTAKCGNIALGRIFEIGSTRYGSSIGILDYSQKETDADGVISITEGYWAKEHAYTLITRSDQMTAVYQAIVALRATPTAWIAADGADYDLFITYGILRDFSITVPGPTVSICNLDIEGLT